MKKTTLFALALITLWTGFALAQGSWSFSGQVRHRFEVDSRDFDADTDLDNFSLLRSRLGATFTPREDLTAFVQIQDSRVFGEEPTTLSDTENVDLHQGYIGIREIFDLPVDVKLGRMEVNLGPQRLVGAVGWSNVGRSFDGVNVTVKGSGFALDLFEFREKEGPGGAAGDRGDQNVFGAYADIEGVPKTATQVFAIWQRRSPSDELSRYTLGFYLKGAIQGFRHETELAYQGGDFTDSLDVKAWMGAVNVAYAFLDVPLQPELGVGVDHLSGDPDLSDDDHEVFDTLYATNHKYYGFMDYFVNIPGDTRGLGLTDLHAKASARLEERTTAAAAFHVFRAAEEITLSGGATSRAFGQEIDLTLKHRYEKSLTFQGGASLFFPGSIFDEFRGGDTASWFYLMTTLTM